MKGGETDHVCVVAFLVGNDNVQEKGTIEKIQMIRKRHDQAYSRWLPHVTLIPPFIIPFGKEDQKKKDVKPRKLTLNESKGGEVGEGGLEDGNASHELTVTKDLDMMSRVIEEVCGRHSQACLTFDQVGHFSLRLYDTIHLRPSDSSSGLPLLDTLQRDLSLALPQILKSLRGKRPKQKQSFNPHLTLGQSRTETESKVIYDMANNLLLDEGSSAGKQRPLSVLVDKIQLMVKPASQSGPYNVYAQFHLAQQPKFGST